MDINKGAAWANVGNFFIGCFTLYAVFSQHPQAPEQGAPARSVTSLHPSMWIFLAGLMVAGFLHVAAALIQRKGTHPEVNVSTDAITTLPVDESRTALAPIAEQGTTISLSPQELVRLFKTGGTSAQAERLIQPYVGKWMQISGVVDDVTHFGPDTNQVSLTGTMGLGLQFLMYFREKWTDEVSMLVKGQNITVRGQFTSIPYSDTVRLVECELLTRRRS